MKQLDGFPTSYWRTSMEFLTYPKLDTNRVCDFVIVGAGIAGLVTAQGLITREISLWDQP